MSSFRCKFCDLGIPIMLETYRSYSPCFDSSQWRSSVIHPSPNPREDGILVEFFKCPECKKVSVKIKGEGTQYPQDYFSWFYPSSDAKKYPDYIPVSIRQDYEEAYMILNLSPKSSATLSRRCIQGMIRDVFKVEGKNLYNEIDAIQDSVDPTTLKALHSLRQLGNIGAHMEKNINMILEIEPYEAEKLLKLVEYFIKIWYIDVHDKEELCREIIAINTDKQLQRDANSSSSL